jgi:hypothetical protein
MLNLVEIDRRGPHSSHESPGLLRRMLTAILGKSSSAYMKQFSGSDAYWDNVIAAQRGWPREQPPKAEPDQGRREG